MIKLLKRAAIVYKERGLSSLLNGIRNLIRDWTHNYFTVYYMYKRTFKKRNEEDFLPKINDYSFKVVTNIGELDDLIADGYDFGPDDTYMKNMRMKIEKGCIGFFLFIGKELGNRTLAATSEEAMSTFNRHPYKVDFSNHEVCGTDTWTNPKYRRLGLSTYRSYKQQLYLLDKGFTTEWSIIETNNEASNRQHMKASAGGEEEGPYSKVWYFKIFGKEFWKEKLIIRT